MQTIDRRRLTELLELEQKRFEDEHPSSRTLFDRARGSMVAGVPMPWMTQWAGRFPVFVANAHGARVTDVDGHTYTDFCLGDTGSMTGHAPRATTDAIARQAQRGITFMLPTEDSIWVGEELARRFGLPFWQFALTATDANRFVLRLARELTGRPRVLVYSWCYHGTVDETFIVLENGAPRPRPFNMGPPVDPTVTTRVIEWNDTDALQRALEPEDVAVVLAEPAMTNIGIILPDDGYHDALRALTRAHGTLLLIDETHTLCTGPGGYTRAKGLEPDFITVGKPLAAGVPAAAYGMSHEVATRLEAHDVYVHTSDVAGVGGTLSGNALSLAAMRATLEGVLTEKAFDHMIELGQRFAQGVDETIASRHLPWHAIRLGCRVEYRFRPEPPRTGAEGAAAHDVELDRFAHLFTLNRGILMTPFHNMALMCPATTAQDVDAHTEVFESCADELIG
jgi:glutamate-1-semialdehyde 2,1-aminomutase